MLCAAALAGCSSGGATVRSGASPQEAAQTESADLLSAFRAPPGAKQLPGEPDGVPWQVQAPFSRPMTPDLVVRTSWWSVPGPAERAAAWVAAHAPSGAKGGTSGGGGGGAGGVMALYTGFDRPATQILATRTLDVSAVDFHGGTLLRVDAEVVWLRERPAGARVPSSVTRLVVRAHLGVNRSGSDNSVVTLATVTDPASVRRAVELVNGLPMAGRGTGSCPMDDGRSLRLEFYADGSSHVAVVDSAVSGCLVVDLSVRGGPQHTVLEGATTGFDEKLLSLLGLRFPTG